MAKILQSPRAEGIPLPVTLPPPTFPGKVFQAELGQKNMVLAWCVGQGRMWFPPFAGGEGDWCFRDGMGYDVKADSEREDAWCGDQYCCSVCPGTTRGAQ